MCKKNIEEIFCNPNEYNVKLKLEIVNEDCSEACVWITASNLEKFNQAVRLIHELLANVYEEYKKFCELNKLVYNSNLHIKKLEKFIQDPDLKFIENRSE